MNIINVGSAKINHKQAVAGSYVSIRYTYQTQHPIDDTGYIKIVFRDVCDFGTPQFDNPKDDNYCSVSTTGNCRIECRWDSNGNTRPWSKALYLVIMGGYLDEGDTVTVVFGDRTKGSRGWQIQTFCEDTFEFKTLIDPIATYRFKELAESPKLKIIPGTPVRAVCIGPSQVDVNCKFHYYIKHEDHWGNAVRKPKRYTHKGFEEPGIVNGLSVTDNKTGLAATSNPIRAVDPIAGSTNHYWSDFHGQSEESVGTNTIDDYLLLAGTMQCLIFAGIRQMIFRLQMNSGKR